MKNQEKKSEEIKEKLQYLGRKERLVEEILKYKKILRTKEN